MLPLIPARLLLSFRLTAPYPACCVSRLGSKGFVHFYPVFQQRAKAAPDVRGESGKYLLMILAACVLVAPFKQILRWGYPVPMGNKVHNPIQHLVWCPVHTLEAAVKTGQYWHGEGGEWI